jgi:hypothetical protein
MRATPYISVLLIVSVALLPTDVARADLISTERAINSDAQTYRETILALLKHPEVVRQLELLGVEQTVAEKRVAAMTDEEALDFVSNLDSVPAGGQMGPSGAGYGGGGGSGVAIVLIIVLLIFFLVWWSTKQAG